MASDIAQIIDFIKERTGRKVVVYSESTDYVSSVDEENPKRSAAEVTAVLTDKDSDKTYFPFRYKTENYVGYIDGSGETERELAGLIAALFESGVVKERTVGKNDALRSIIVGEASDIQTQKFMRKYEIPDLPCSAYMVYSKSGKVKDVINFIENFRTSKYDMAVSVDEYTCAYVRFKEKPRDEADFQTITDHAYLLAQSIEEELGIKVVIGVGSGVRSFAECPTSYGQAATAIRMNDFFGRGAQVSAYKDYVLIKMIEELPKYKLQEYLGVLTDPEAETVLSDPDMVGTAEEFLRTSLNVSETSRNLYMHRNTLMYRLDKIERATGLDIRKFQDAATFRLILILYKLK